MLAAGGVVGLGGLAAIALWGAGAATVLVATAILLLSAGSLLSWLRGEEGHAAAAERGIAGLGYAAVLGIALVQSLIVETATAGVLGLVGVGATIVARRVPVTPPPWAASAASAPVLLLPFALAGQVTAGLVVVALHAAAGLIAAIELLRRV